MKIWFLFLSILGAIAGCQGQVGLVKEGVDLAGSDPTAGRQRSGVGVLSEYPHSVLYRAA